MVMSRSDKPSFRWGSWGSAVPSVMILGIEVCLSAASWVTSVYTALDVFVTVPLGVLLLVRRLELRQVHRVPQEPSNASKPSAELAAFLQANTSFQGLDEGSLAGCSCSTFALLHSV